MALPRDTPTEARHAIAAARQVGHGLRAGQAKQKAYGMLGSMVTYLASLGAFGDEPPAGLARFTAVGSAALQSQSRDARVDLLATLGHELPSRARTLIAAGRSEPELEAVLQPLDTGTLTALRAGPSPVDPQPYVLAIETLEARVADSREAVAEATATPVATPSIRAVPLARTPLVAGLALLGLMLGVAAVGLAAARRHGAQSVVGGTDALTGAWTRRRLGEALDDSAGTGAVVMVDISTTSSRSTTPADIPPAMTPFGVWRVPSARACGAPTASIGTAARSSARCWPERTRSRRRRSPSGFGR